MKDDLSKYSDATKIYKRVYCLYRVAKSMLFLNYCNSNKNTFWHKLIVLLARDDVLMACLFLYNSLNK